MKERAFYNKAYTDWLKDELEKRDHSKRWLARNSFDASGEPMTDAHVIRILNNERGLHAEHAIRFGRALKIEFLQMLCLSGFITQEEVSLSKKFTPDDPALYRIWGILRELDHETLELVEQPILSSIESVLRARGGKKLRSPEEAAKAGAADAEMVRKWRDEEEAQGK